MSKRLDIEKLIGIKYENLVVLDSFRQKNDKNIFGVYVVVKCICGKTFTVLWNCVKQGHYKSCGCLRNKILSEKNTIHGDNRPGHQAKLHRVWAHMISRCYNKNVERFKNYGGRGISVCQDWKDYVLFKKWALESGYKDGLSIERIDVNRNYNPENCKWIEKKLQAKNKQNTVWINIGKETKTLAEWCILYSIAKNTVYHRIKYYGWPPEKALKIPSRKHK